MTIFSKISAAGLALQFLLLVYVIVEPGIKDALSKK